MSGPLLSRFDLVYVLLDRPDEARDRQLSEHLVALRSGVPWPLGRIATCPRKLRR